MKGITASGSVLNAVETAAAVLFGWTPGAEFGSLAEMRAPRSNPASAGTSPAAQPAIDFQALVTTFQAPLFHFALSLARDHASAADLTQQTFYLWATKGHQLRDAAKVKSWLFTTLYREHLSSRRHAASFPQVELDEGMDQLSDEHVERFSRLDGAAVMEALAGLDEIYRAPLTLFYLKDFAYREIAEILSVPIGTVMSRLSRGKVELRRLLANPASMPAPVIPFPPVEPGTAS